MLLTVHQLLRHFYEAIIKMREEILSCFGVGSDYNSLHMNVNGKLKSKGTNQTVATAVYETKVAGRCRRVTISWSKKRCVVLQGVSLQVDVDDPDFHYTYKVEMRPWLFWTMHGCKIFVVGGHKLEIHWDLSAAKFAVGPEPQGGYYVAMVCEKEMVLLLGDMSKEALKKIKATPSKVDATLVSRREHLLGEKVFTTKTQIGDAGGRMHEVMIDFENAENGEPQLCIRVDRKLAVQVKRLMWKFRGNESIVVDGMRVEVLWDVHNWLFKPCTNSTSGSSAHAIFIFQTCSSLSNGKRPWFKGTVIACRSSPPDHDWSSKRSTGYGSTSSSEKPLGFALFLCANKTP